MADPGLSGTAPGLSGTPASAQSGPRVRLARLLRAAGPLAISVLALYFVWRRVPFRDVRQALLQAELRYFLPLMGVYFFSVLSADAFALSRTLRWFLRPVRFLETMRIRASTYIVSLFNYHLGQGALAIYLSRKKGVSLAAAGGTILLMMGVNLIVVLGVSAGGTLLARAARGGAAAGPALPSPLGALLAVAMAGLSLYLLVISGRPRWLSARLSRVAVLEPLFRAGVRGHLLAIGVRLPHVFVMVLGHYLALRCFHVVVPWHHAVAAIPLILLVGALPIAIQGIGPVQVASIALLARYAQAPTQAMREAVVVAESLSLSSLFLLCQLCTGLLLLRRALRDLVPEAAEPAPTPLPGSPPAATRAADG